MGIDVKAKIKQLRQEQQRKIEARAAELIREERMRREGRNRRKGR